MVVQNSESKWTREGDKEGGRKGADDDGDRPRSEVIRMDSGRRMKAHRGPVKGMKRKLFNDLWWRARFLLHRTSSFRSFSFSAVSTLLSERRIRIDCLERATVFFDFSSWRYLHIKISLTPRRSELSYFLFFLLVDFNA